MPFDHRSTSTKDDSSSRKLTVWGMVVGAFVFFGALIGGIAAMIMGVKEDVLGLVLFAILGGGWVIGRGIGRVAGWEMFRETEVKS
jgi:succinate-acetate transporter protein